MLALLCGGQGLVSPQMFDLVAEAPAAAPIFACADRLLGQDPRRLVHDTAGDALSSNRQNQLLSVTAVLATYAAIADLLPPRFLVTGYSVGEMAAWSIAGIWSADLALKMTDQRARIMDEAGAEPGRLVYTRGLGRSAVEKLAAQNGAEIAIMNPGDLFVLGTTEANARRFCEAARQAGALKAEPLAVHVAAHTSLLRSGVAPFATVLRDSAPAAPKDDSILLAGGNGARIFRPDLAIKGLAAQIATPIDWVSTLEALAEHGVDTVLDLGPGAALAPMVSSAQPGITAYAAAGFRSLDGLRTWLSDHPR
ncbi:malonate decarboxylase subunit epsilon [Acidisoma cellulosilytica]|uniref:Malonate decarboxylase subunit epsilon n=1 Tax=Acidisoma cellulosilyticum TaxID=2802395 RepID=A0A964E4F9_9PROT|nr:malonate decarboxylase subunit epsilon [Acidisoma cellulosilyticum]MCB8881429.1 malonate decarboxylase subunit epsilon [Acidisoma cellulosilyticum]